MAIDKIVADVEAAIEGVEDGQTLLVGGFGEAGSPVMLMNALARRPLRDLTIVSNNAGSGEQGLAALIARGCVRKMICSYPKPPGSEVFGALYREGKVELELVPQGTLSERIRAAGAGIGGFYTRTGADTALAEGKEKRTIGGEQYVLESPLRGDFAFIRAWRADRWGNVVYRKSARNFGPVMASAAATTVVEVREVVALGSLDPEAVVTPGIYVDRVVAIGSDRAVLDDAGLVETVTA